MLERRGGGSVRCLSSASCPGRPPSIKRSMGRNTNSMYTVWGHAQPHQPRPNSAVTQMMNAKMLSMSSIKSTPSVARNVRPKRWNCRAGDVEQHHGLAVHLQERQRDEQRDQRPSGDDPGLPEPAAVELRPDLPAGAVRVERRQHALGSGKGSGHLVASALLVPSGGLPVTCLPRSVPTKATTSMSSAGESCLAHAGMPLPATPSADDLVDVEQRPLAVDPEVVGQVRARRRPDLGPRDRACSACRTRPCRSRPGPASAMVLARDLLAGCRQRVDRGGLASSPLVSRESRPGPCRQVDSARSSRWRRRTCPRRSRPTSGAAGLSYSWIPSYS